MKTILITGASSGFGLETARTFLDRGWAVIATMRKPRDDVTSASDVAKAIWRAVNDPSSLHRVPAGADAVALAGSPRNTVAQLLKRSLDTFLDKDTKSWAELCDQNVVVEFPFAPDLASRKIVGRSANRSP